MDRILTIAWLRLKLVLRQMQGTGGLWNAIGAVLLGILSVTFAFGVALGLGYLVHRFVVGGDPDSVRTGFLIVFYLCLVVGVVLPLVRGVMHQGFDASPFVVFPIERSRLYAITLAASALATDHLLYYPTLVAVTVTGVLLPGAAVGRGLAIVLLLALFFVTWSNVVGVFLTSVMRARRVREIGAIVALGLIILVSFTPAVLEGSQGRIGIDAPRLKQILEVTLNALSGLPPSIAADGLATLHADTGNALSAIGWLLLWNAVGLWLGYRLFSRQLLREGVVRAARTRRARESGRLGRLFSFDGPLLGCLPSEVRAVASKDLRYLLRSVVGRFVLFMAPVFTLLIGMLLGDALDEPVFGIRPERLLLFGLMLYAVLFSSNFLYNAFAWEGDGVKAYFLCPVQPDRVLIGKNLAVWIYNVLLFLLVLVTFSVASGPPDPVTVVSAVLIYATTLVIFTGVGNILSIRFPTPRDMSSTRNHPAQIAILVSLLVLIGTGVLLGPFVSLPMLLGVDLLMPVLLAGLCGAAVYGYRLTLRYSARLFSRRRDQVIESLKTAR